MGSLFREEVLHAQRSQWLGAINLATPLAFVWWVLLAAALAAAIVLLLVFGHYTRRASVTGQLEPVAGMLTLAAKTTGTVTIRWCTKASRSRPVNRCLKCRPIWSAPAWATRMP